MGQYWLPVNLDKREFIHPHKLGAGLKLWEQLANHPGTGTALLILCAAMPESRGGGDLNETTPGGEQVIGRWAGDRIALVGDYAEDGDLAPEHEASKIYDRCQPTCEDVFTDAPTGLPYEGFVQSGKQAGKYVHTVEVAPPAFRDVTDLVAQVIEKELDGKFKGDGWRRFEETRGEGIHA